jgi:hypothetical protein
MSRTFWKSVPRPRMTWEMNWSIPAIIMCIVLILMMANIFQETIALRISHKFKTKHVAIISVIVNNIWCL